MRETTATYELHLTRGERAFGLILDYWPTWLVAAVVFGVAYDNGGFAESTRDTGAIVLWWVLILIVVLGIRPAASVKIPRLAALGGGLLALFALFTLLSTAWAANPAAAYGEFTRVALYVAIFAVAVLGSTRANASSWTDGLAVGIVAIAIVALVSRLLPHAFPHSNTEISRFLPGATTRLSFPIGYWNGLGIFVALGVPLLLRAAVRARSDLVRGLAVAPIPIIAGIEYLTSTRTGVIAGVTGSVVFLALSSRRWAVAGAGLVAAAGSAAVVVTLNSRNELVNGPLSSGLAHTEGRSAAIGILCICILTGLVYGLGIKVASGYPLPKAIVGRVLVLAAVLVVVAGIAAAHPVARVEGFTKPPAHFTTGSYTQQHLLSTSGNGRWQLWGAAWKEFTSAPLHGQGAGSFGTWWLQHATLAAFATDAHSLYLQVLGELGIIGLVLLVAAFAVGLAAAARRLFRVDDEQRHVLAAATAAFVAFAVAAAADWMWQLPVVTAVAIVCLGLMTGRATSPAPQLRSAPREHGPSQDRLARYAAGVAALVGVWLLICAIAIPLLSDVKLKDSQDAAGRGDATAAIRSALAARAIEPWSAQPYLQVALVTEQAGRYRPALAWIDRAISHSDQDWQLWLVKTRIETELGDLASAKKAEARVRSLNLLYQH